MADAEFTTHRLRQNDISDMRALLSVFADAFEMDEEYLNAQPGNDYLQTRLSAPHFITLVAKKEDEIIGGLCAYVLDKFEQQRAEIYLYDLAVLCAYRRRGVATALIQALKSEALACGANVIFVQADGDDHVARSLYSGLGQPEKVVHYDINPHSK